MRTKKELFEEQLDISQESIDLAADIADLHRKYFPHGWINARAQHSFGPDDVISISCGIIGDKRDLPSNYFENDPARHTFIIRPGKGWEATQGTGQIYVNPPKGSYNVMAGVKTKFRKSSGNYQKMVVTFDKFFKNLKALIKDNEDNIYRRDSYNDKYFK